MQIINIEVDIKRGYASGLRDAFAALRFPKRETIVDARGDGIDDDHRQLLLDAVCERLSGDGGIMPAGLCDELNLPQGSTMPKAPRP